MTGSPRATPTGPYLLLYDGDCGICTRAARWVTARAGTAVVPIAANRLDDGALGALGLTRADTDAAAWLVHPDGTLRRGHLAVADALQAAAGWPRLAGRAIAVPPLTWLAIPLYAAVARWRHLLPGSTRCGTAAGD